MKHLSASPCPRNHPIPLLICTIMALLSLSACAQPGAASTTSASTNSPAAVTTTGAPSTSGSPAATAQSYSFPVFQNDKQVATLTLADLQKLPQISETVEGTSEQGPTLISALNSIGIKDFTQVTIDGFTKGRLATAELVLQKSQVTDDIMLALVARGSVKLTGTSIGAAKAIIDVNKVTVK